jgi:hypothetical protein
MSHLSECPFRFYNLVWKIFNSEPNGSRCFISKLFVKMAADINLLLRCNHASCVTDVSLSVAFDFLDISR